MQRRVRRGRGDAVAVETEHPGARPKSGRAALGETWRALRAVFAKPSLRRMQLALAASLVGDWAYSTAVTVWAYREGGAAARRALGRRPARAHRGRDTAWAPRSSTASRARPSCSSPPSCGPRLVAAAVVALVVDAPAWVVLVLATLAPARRLRVPAGTARLAAVADVAPRRAHRRQRGVEHHRQPGLPHRAGDRRARRRDDERGDDVRRDGGDVPRGRGPRRPDPPGRRGPRRPRARPAGARDEADAGGERSSSGASADASPRPGLAARPGQRLHDDRPRRNLGMVMVLICVQMVVSGAMVVLGVVFAVDILGTGPAGVGLIDSVLGIGAVVGGFVAIARSVRNKIALDLVTGTLLWSLPAALRRRRPLPRHGVRDGRRHGLRPAPRRRQLRDPDDAAHPRRPARPGLRRLRGHLHRHDGARVGRDPVPPRRARDPWRPRRSSRVRRRGPRPRLHPPRPPARRHAAAAAGTDLLAGIPMFAPLAPASLEFLARRLVAESAAAGHGDRARRATRPTASTSSSAAASRSPRAAGSCASRAPASSSARSASCATCRAPRPSPPSRTPSLVSLTREDFLGAVHGTDASMAAAYDIVTSRLG